MLKKKLLICLALGITSCLFYYQGTEVQADAAKDTAISEVDNGDIDNNEDKDIYVEGNLKYVINDDDTAEVIGYVNEGNEIRIPDKVVINNKTYSVTSIGDYAFKNCEIYFYYLNNRIRSIGKEAFCGSNIAGIEIPECVEEIGDRAFSMCRSIELFEVSPNNRNYTSVKGVLYTKDMKKIITYPNLNPMSLDRDYYSFSIPEGVEEIGEYCFYNSELHALMMPKSIKKIDDTAFNENPNLKSLILPDTIIDVDLSPIYENADIKAIWTSKDTYEKLDKKYTQHTKLIESNFYENRNLYKAGQTPIKIKADYVNVEKYVYSGIDMDMMSELCRTDIDDKGYFIHDPNVEDGRTTTYYYSAYMDGEKYYGPVLDITMNNRRPSVIKNIRYDGNCYGLCEDGTAFVTDICCKRDDNTDQCPTPSKDRENIVIPEQIMYQGKFYKVTRIGKDAFNCSFIKSITIPGTVTEIDDDAFISCWRLRNISFNEGLIRIGDGAFRRCENLESLKLPSSLKEIGSGAFDIGERGKLKDIYIPENVEKIGIEPFRCSELKKIEVSDNNRYYKDIDGILFDIEGKTLITSPTKFNKEYLKIPEGTRYILEYAFKGEPNIESVIIPDSVIYLGYSNSLKNIALWGPKKILDSSDEFSYKIESNLYDRDNYVKGKDPVKIKADSVKCFEVLKNGSTKEIELNKDEEGYFVHDIDGEQGEEKTFYYEAVINGHTSKSAEIKVKMAKTEVIEKPLEIDSVINGVTYKGNDDGSVSITGYDNSQGDKLVLPQSINIGGTSYKVTKIDDNAFLNCYSIREISIPEGIKSIGNNAFENCSSLKLINIPDSVSDIGDNAFLNCSNLNNVKFGQGLKTIGKSAFKYCSNLNAADLPESLTTIKDNAFYCCSAMESIYIPIGCVEFGKNVIANCSNLKKVVCSDEIYKAVKNDIPYGCNVIARDLSQIPNGEGNK